MSCKTSKAPGAKVTPDNPFYDIVQDAYRVFDYGKPDSLGVCENCCMYPDVEADFLNPPIAEMPVHYLQDWFFAACESPLHKRIWGYLLPRVLEVLACGQDPANVGLEVSLNRFSTGDASQWSAREWDVLDRFQRLYLRQQVETTQPYLDDTLCMFALAGWDLDDLFAQVAAFPDGVLAQRFWSDWCIGCPSIWITAFWTEPGNQSVFAFYTSRQMYRRMERLALDETTESKLAEKALAVASVIQDNADWAQLG